MNVYNTPNRTPIKNYQKTKTNDYKVLERDAIYNENSILKNQMKKVKSDMNTFKAEIARLTNELSIRDKIVQEMLNDDRSAYNYESSYNNSNNYGSPMPKNKESNILANLKKDYKELQNKYKQKVDEIEQLRRQNRSNNFNELLIENQALFEEIERLNDMNQNISNNQELVTIQETLDKVQKRNTILMVDLKNKNEEINHLKKLINEKNNDILYLKKELELHCDFSNRMNDEEAYNENNIEQKIEMMRTEISNYKEVLR